MQGISQKLLALGEGEESRTLLLRKERFISRLTPLDWGSGDERSSVRIFWSELM